GTAKGYSARRAPASSELVRSLHCVPPRPALFPYTTLFRSRRRRRIRRRRLLCDNTRRCGQCQRGGDRERKKGKGVRPLFMNGSQDRKSTRLNSSHRTISYAVFCLKKKITTAPSRHSTRHSA